MCLPSRPIHNTTFCDATRDLRQFRQVNACRVQSQGTCRRSWRKFNFRNMRRATYTNRVQFLLWVRVQYTWIVLLVHRDVANTKKIVNRHRVSLPQLVAGVASRMSRRKSCILKRGRDFTCFTSSFFCALLRAQLHSPIP